MMKKFKGKFTVISGVIVVLLLAASSWYTITLNDPMAYRTIQPRDLPLLISLGLFVLYMGYLGALAIGFIAEGRKQAASKTTRKIDPRLGFLGFFGFLGFLGFWTYSMDKSTAPFAFFIFFGFFSFFYEGKMSNTFKDERYQENRARAELTAHRVALSIIFASLLLLNLNSGALFGHLEYTLIALIILIALALALDVFLWGYLLYRYDHEDQMDVGEGD